MAHKNDLGERGNITGMKSQVERESETRPRAIIISAKPARALAWPGGGSDARSLPNQRHRQFACRCVDR
jgi:hypothetical protein